MSKTIHLGPKLSLSANAFATNVVAALGMRGSGKSNVMTLAVEQLLAAGIQVVVLDYVGIFFGLRLQPDGKRPSPFQIPVLGGRHGDIPLVSAAGKQVAEALAASHSSAVLDISAFSKGDRIRFAADFGEAFFHAKKTHGGPVFLVLEEAQRFVPQVMRFSDPGLSRCLGAYEEIAEVGRNYGIGLGLISQRPQKLNKDVLNLAELVFAFQTNGVLERKAIAEWVQEKGADGRGEVTGELPGLPRGTALVWSPSTFKLYGKYAFEKKATYDAGATPDQERAAVTVRPLDLKSLEGAMATVVQEAKASDPRALKARIAELEREVLRGPATAAAIGPRVVEKSVIKPADLDRLERLIARVGSNEDAFLVTVESLRVKLLGSQMAVRDAIDALKVAAGLAKPAPTPARAAAPARLAPPPPAARADGEAGDIGRCARALLGVIVQRGVASDSQVSALSGYRKTSSTFGNGLTTLRTRGLIDGSRDRLAPTPAGRDLIGPTEPLPEGRALLDYWIPRLGKCEATMLRAIYEAGTIARPELSDRTGYSATSSTFGNGLTGLRTLDLVYGPTGGDITIADIFTEASP